MIQDKSRFVQKFVKANTVFILLVSVLGAGYFIWMRFRIPLVFYISNYRNISYIIAIVFYISYVFIVLMMYFSQISVRSLKTSKIGIISTGMFLVTTILCCVSCAILPSLPRVLDKTELSNITYYLTGELEVLDSHAFSRLYECNKTTYQCEQTIFFDGGGGAGFRDLHLMIDEAGHTDEIHVIYTGIDGFEILEFTQGPQPRYYDYPAQLGNHLYYLAHYRDTIYRPESTTFVLYECNLDNTSCTQLPILYEGFGYLRDTIANETTGEINIFIDDQSNQDTLIFTWGENPRCFVNGCKILE